MDTERFRKMLLDERDRVTVTVESLHEANSGSSLEEETEEETYDNHLADSATATLNREIDHTLEENAEHVLGGINQALARIDDGTFGTCTGCGKEIAEERLEARPYATRCIDCQRLAERV
jgi:RNA polymerase-binding protein DksA